MDYDEEINSDEAFGESDESIVFNRVEDPSDDDEQVQSSSDDQDIEEGSEEEVSEEGSEESG